MDNPGTLNLKKTKKEPINYEPGRYQSASTLSISMKKREKLDFLLEKNDK